MSDELVLRIEADGSVVGLSGSGIEEILDLRTFGPMTARRAGRISFDELSQTWGWHGVDRGMAWAWGGGFATRRDAVADEITVLSAAL